MKKLLLVLLTGLLVTLLFAGCSTHNMPHGGVMPGLVYGDGTYPSMKDSYTKFQFNADDIVVLGTVNGQGESFNVLFLVSVGNNGYQQLLNEAKQQYPDMDALINFYWDTNFLNVAIPFPFYIPLFQRAKSNVTATAIKFKNK